MFNPTPWPKRTNERGSILLVTFFLCMIAALSSLWMVATLNAHQRTNQRQREVNRAYFAAEAGVAQILHWGNFPDDYDGLGPDGLFYRDILTGDFPKLSTATMLTEIVIPSEKLSKMTSKYGDDISNISEITLVPADPASDLVNTLFKVRAVGKTPGGAQRKILAYLYPNPVDTTDIKLPAALLSKAAAGMGGNARIHWGQAWSKTSFDMLSRSQSAYLNQSGASYDIWAKYRCESSIEFDPTWKSGVGKDIFDEATRQFPGTAPASGNFANALEQNLPPGTLEWPDFLGLYDTFKEMAKSHGRYYGTDAAGKIYKDGVKQADHEVDFISEFEKVDRDSSYYDLVFIDTIDETFPKGDGSNIATITSAGTGTGLKGVFWMGANFVVGGVGSPPTLGNAEKPDGSVVSLEKIYLDGVLYSAGTIDQDANVGIYGCVFTERGFVGIGTPDVYYNHRLEDGLELPKGNLGSVFKIVLQKNYGDD